ncbi:hypothetical protein T02_9913 [Trichinella nativa]|uniref:Uncharacterized protein n=1 Tax=Trichinella nativa TaxID=6335 RepID=A0A0V1KLA7_9BILA|nr:hypothetical protein T02_9913 [Trichinella nativa]
MLVTRPRHWQYTQATHPSAKSRPSIVNGANAMTITDRRLETAKQSSREIVESIGRQRIRRGRSRVNTDVMHWRSSKNKEAKRQRAEYVVYFVFFLWIALRFDLSGVDRNKAPDSQRSFMKNGIVQLWDLMVQRCISTSLHSMDVMLMATSATFVNSVSISSCPISRESSLKSYLVCADQLLALWRDMIYQSQAINKKGIPEFPNVEKFLGEPAPLRHEALQ